MPNLTPPGDRQPADLADGPGAWAANLGALTLSFRTLWQAPLSDASWHIWLNIRLPRVLLAVVIAAR
ncbi:Putative heme degradation protein [Serratia fonticola]|uniref:Heme degradation protein n=1 Tax=Serratia fonticola TaxID=47917 RepID=A0A4U9WEM3_SERFO|nr:Putative heme degradation protein [Serratia fonticola]